MKSMRLTLASLFFSLIYFSTPTLADNKQLSLEDIVGLPEIRNVILSPTGRYVAFIQKVDTNKYSGLAVSLLDVIEGKQTPILFSDNKKYIITSMLWGNNDTILIEAKYPAVRSGTPVTESRLMRLNIHDQELKSVLSRRMINKMIYVPNVLSTIVDLLPADEEHILMSLAGFDNGKGESVVIVPITDNSTRTTFEQRARKNVIEWITDAKHQVRIGVRQKNSEYTVFENKEGKSIPLWKFDAFSAETIWPLGFGSDNNMLYVQALYQGRDAIYKVDLTDPSLTKQIVYFDEHYDVAGRLIRSRKNNEFVGIGYEYWDKEYQSFSKAIDNALPNTDNAIIDFSADGNKYIVFSSSDADPGAYLLGDRKNGTLEVLAYRKPKLKPSKMSEKSFISYEARDGLKIEGYLTTPKNSTGKNLPTIIFPHGGPISYDGSGFDYWTQFFANKGYAVLQMNFRGSSGYGHNFMQQGLGKWGQAMQDDVEDGARWLIKNGIADKERMCIVGASYGGYAALMGAIKSPELYQCVISFAGVTDVEQLVKSSRRFTNYDIVKKQVGDDFDALWEVSPLKHAKKINVPVLLIHGDKDRVVNVEHSEDMYDELKSEGKQVNFVEIEMADHFLSNNENRIQAFTAMDEFLNTYLPTPIMQ